MTCMEGSTKLNKGFPHVSLQNFVGKIIHHERGTFCSTVNLQKKFLKKPRYKYVTP